MTGPARRTDAPYVSSMTCTDCGHPFHPYACRERVDGARCECGSAT